MGIMKIIRSESSRPANPSSPPRAGFSGARRQPKPKIKTTMNINDIKALNDGAAITELRLKLLNLWERKEGQGQHGPWSIQNAVFTDGGQEIKAMIKDRDELPKSGIGDWITISSVNGAKGLSGLYAFDDEYQGNTERKIKITGSAQMNRDWDTDKQPAPAALQDSPPTKKQSPPFKAAPNVDKLTEAKRTLIQITNLHALCRFSVERVESPLIKSVTGRDMNENELQSATSSIFIKADRLGLSLSMPTSPFTAADFPTK